MARTEIDYIEEVTKLEDFNDEYVYDIGVESNDPYFFANDLMVHNSVYFSAHPFINHTLDCDSAIELYDAISDEVNNSFPAFMQKAFHCPKELGEIIKGGREIVAVTGLFITKKRYAALVLDNEGERQDVNGKPGKLKAMGLDLKRSDTPVIVQDFLKDILMDTLTGKDKDSIFEKIRDFKQLFNDLPPWEKGSPKRVNNLTKHTAVWEKTGSCGVGHAMAAINYNRLIKMHGDNYSIPVTDGMKTIVCQLKDNPLGMNSVCRPTDEKHIPEWFKELPFDDDKMANAVVNKKIDNLLGVLKWDINSQTDVRSTFNSLFG